MTFVNECYILIGAIMDHKRYGKLSKQDAAWLRGMHIDTKDLVVQTEFDKFKQDEADKDDMLNQSLDKLYDAANRLIDSGQADAPSDPPPDDDDDEDSDVGISEWGVVKTPCGMVNVLPSHHPDGTLMATLRWSDLHHLIEFSRDALDEANEQYRQRQKVVKVIGVVGMVVCALAVVLAIAAVK